MVVGCVPKVNTCGRTAVGLESPAYDALFRVTGSSRPRRLRTGGRMEADFLGRLAEAVPVEACLNSWTRHRDADWAWGRF